jgi:hypothetical protein
MSALPSPAPSIDQADGAGSKANKVWSSFRVLCVCLRSCGAAGIASTEPQRQHNFWLAAATSQTR